MALQELQPSEPPARTSLLTPVTTVLKPLERVSLYLRDIGIAYFVAQIILPDGYCVMVVPDVNTANQLPRINQKLSR